MLTGCSLRPHKDSASKVEKIARQCINSNVTSTGGKITTEDSGAGAYVWYPMVDERGIEFNVGIDNRYIAFVEPIKPFYSKYYEYKTNYKQCVADYYREEIEELINKCDVVDYKIYGGMTCNIIIEFAEGEDLDTIAQTIMSINDLLAFDYACNDTVAVKIDNHSIWEEFCSYDILVNMYKYTDDKKENIFYCSFKFSDGYKNKLTYDEVYETLNSFEH